MGDRFADQEPDEDADRQYFQAIEERFILLRGAPLLLSPEDWRTAQEWRRRGVPLELVLRTLSQVFARREERGAKGRINSLRYVAPAVREAWAEAQEVRAGGAVVSPTSVDPAERLAALAASLPEDLPGRDRLADKIAEAGHDTDEVERNLAALESETLQRLWDELASEPRKKLMARLERQLRRWSDRIGADDREELRELLYRRLLRRHFRLPVFSIFATEE